MLGLPLDAACASNAPNTITSMTTFLIQLAITIFLFGSDSSLGVSLLQRRGSVFRGAGSAWPGRRIFLRPAVSVGHELAGESFLEAWY